MPRQLQFRAPGYGKLPNNPLNQLAVDPLKFIGDDPFLTMAEEIIFGAADTMIEIVDYVTGLDLLPAALMLQNFFVDEVGGAGFSGFVSYLNNQPTTNPKTGLDTPTTAPVGLFTGLLSWLTSGFGVTNAGETMLSRMITAAGGTGNTLADFGSLFAALGLTAEQIAQDIFGVPSGDLTLLGGNLMSLLGGPNLNVPTGFDPVTAVAPFINNVLTPTGLLATLTSGLLSASVIPLLDASKVGTGIFSTSLIPNLPASIINSGIFSTSLIPNLPASIINSGVFTTSLIPNLPASIINSGVFGASLIPALDTSKITTGTFGTAFVPWAAPIDTLIQAWGGTGSGFLPADLTTFASAIPHDNLTGTLGGNTIGTTIQNFLDAGVRAVQNNPALANQTIAQWNNSLSAAFGFFGYNPAGATQPNSVADITSKNDATIKARAVSKKVSANIDQSLDASFDIMSAYAQATLPTITLTQGNPVAGYITTDHGGTKQTAEWEGYVSAGTLTGFYVNLYSVDTSGVWHFIVSSANLKSLLATGTSPQRNFWSIPALNYINSAQGNNYVMELNVTGTGTYTLIGNTYNSNVKSHPTAIPAWHGATRISTTAPTVVSVHNVMQAGNGGSASITIDQSVSDNGALIVMWMMRTTNAWPGGPVLAGVAMTSLGQDNYYLQSGVQSFGGGLYYTKNPPAGAQTLSVASGSGGTNVGVLAIQVANVGSISAVTQNNISVANPTQAFPGGFPNQLVFQGYASTTTTYVTGVTGLNSAWSIYNTTSGYAMGLGAADGTTAKTIGFNESAVNAAMLQYIVVGGLPAQPPPSTVANPSAIGAAANPAVYSLKVPWVGLSGVAGATAYSPVTDAYATPGSGISIQNPAVKYPWANNFDIVMCSDGSGGEGGGYPVGGVGGKAGTWTRQTLTRAQIGTSNLTLNIGGGSGGTSPGAGGSAAAGGVSAVVPGFGTISQTGAPGSGSGLSPSAYGVAGDSPGNFSYTDANGVTVPFTGGAGGSGGQAPGGQPGAGGSGGNATYLPNFNGGNGGAAEVWIRSYQ